MADQTTKPPDRQPVVIAKPRDMTLQAYKDFITGVCEKFGVNKPDYSEAEWFASWQRYLKKAGLAAPTPPPAE